MKRQPTASSSCLTILYSRVMSAAVAATLQTRLCRTLCTADCFEGPAVLLVACVAQFRNSTIMYCWHVYPLLLTASSNYSDTQSFSEKKLSQNLLLELLFFPQQSTSTHFLPASSSNKEPICLLIFLAFCILYIQILSCGFKINHLTA